MGGKSSKVVITPEADEAREAGKAAAPEGTITQLKGIGENGHSETIAPVDDAVPHDDCALADVTTVTEPAVDAAAQPTSNPKKSNLIHFVSKTFSFKSLRTPKKTKHKESSTGDEASQAAHPVANTADAAAAVCVDKEKKESDEKVAKVDVGVPSAEVSKAGLNDASLEECTTATEAAEEDVKAETELEMEMETKGPVVPTTPISNGFHEQRGEEVQNCGDRSEENDVAVSEAPDEVLAGGQGLVEKMAKLGMDMTAPAPQTNGVANHDHDAAVAATATTVCEG